jgi:penicillin-binding protein 2
VVLEKEPVVANKIETDPLYFQLIMDGMEDVTSSEDGGTAGKYFKGKEYLKIAGKTGTSQRTELDVENNAWMVGYAPADDPQIVVVVYIQNGYAGAQASPALVKVIEAYLDSMAESASIATIEENVLAD